MVKSVAKIVLSLSLLSSWRLYCTPRHAGERLHAGCTASRPRQPASAAGQRRRHAGVAQTG